MKGSSEQVVTACSEVIPQENHAVLLAWKNIFMFASA
jgi:hypothetical protein